MTQPLLSAVCDLARAAGAAILEIYAGDIAVRAKTDDSPVTEADERAEAVILAGLAALDPTTPVVSEEAAAAGHWPEVGERFWLVDPLDGTKEFIRRNGEFTVNIALIERGAPVLGVVYAPALGRLFAAAGPGTAILEETGRPSRAISARVPAAEGVVVVTSRSHGSGAALESWLAGQVVAGQRTAGSSLKFCLLAAGEADAYPRFGRTMEWDTAAGDAVLRAAGGRVRTTDGQDLRYGKAGFANPDFVASGCAG